MVADLSFEDVVEEITKSLDRMEITQERLKNLKRKIERHIEENRDYHHFEGIQSLLEFVDSPSFMNVDEQRTLFRKSIDPNVTPSSADRAKYYGQFRQNNDYIEKIVMRELCEMGSTRSRWRRCGLGLYVPDFERDMESIGGSAKAINNILEAI